MRTKAIGFETLFFCSIVGIHIHIQSNFHVILVSEQYTPNWYSAQIQTDWRHFQNEFIDMKTLKNKFSRQKTNLFR